MTAQASPYGKMLCQIPGTLAQGAEVHRQAADHGRVIGDHATNHRHGISNVKHLVRSEPVLGIESSDYPAIHAETRTSRI